MNIFNKRLGKDLHVSFEVRTNGELLPLEGRDIVLELVDPFGIRTRMPFSVSSSRILFHFLGRNQKTIGSYSLTLWENLGKEGQTVVDICNAFTLVPYSCREVDGTADGLEVESVDFDTVDLEVGVKGDSAYEIWLKYGHIGSEEDFILWLRQPAEDAASSASRAAERANKAAERAESAAADIDNKVDKIPGKGLSSNDFTDEEKAKLDGIKDGAEANVQSDWDATDGDAFIKNKPTKVSDFENDASYQTKKEVEQKIADIINSAPEALDTLYELAKALGDDPNFAATVSAAIGKKVDKVGGKQLSTNDFTDEEKQKLQEALPESEFTEDKLGNSGDSFISGTYNGSPVDRAMIPELSANRLAFFDSRLLSVEYSRDYGVTWFPYGDEDTVRSVFSLVRQDKYITLGRRAPDEKEQAGWMLRIKLPLVTWVRFMKDTKIAIGVATYGSYNPRCEFKIVDVSGSEEVIVEGKLEGWYGTNVINIGNKVFESVKSKEIIRGQLVLTFTTNGVPDGIDRLGMQIFYIGLYSPSAFMNSTLKSPMARHGHLYDYDEDQNALFPAEIQEKGVWLRDKYASKTHSHTQSEIEGLSDEILSLKKYIKNLEKLHIGDILVWNEAKQAPEIISSSERDNIESMRSHLFPIGVIMLIEDNVATVVALDELDPTYWAQGHKIKLSDFKSAGGSFDLTMNMSGTDVTGTVTYPANATMQQIVDLIKSAGFTEHLTFEVNEGSKYVTVLHNWWNGGTSSASGDVTYAKLTPCRFQQDYVDTCLEQMGMSNLKDKVITSTICPRKNGISVSWAGCNWDKFYEYYSIYGKEPTEMVELTTYDLVKKTAFENSEFCEKLRAKYGTYEKYIDANMAQYPSERGYISHLNGSENTDVLRQPMWTDADGSKKPAYPAAYDAYNYVPEMLPSNAGAMFGKGKWHLPSGREMYLIINGRTKQADDLVNKTLQGMNGKNLRWNGYYWASTQYYSNSAVFFHGNYGHLHDYRKFGKFSVRPVLAFKLND